MERQNVIIFSVERTENTAKQNKENTKLVWDVLQLLGVDFRLVSGVYQKNTEVSILMPRNEFNTALVHALMIQYNQECYLYTNTRRTARLKYTKSGKTEILGTLNKVSQYKALTLGNYTYDEKSGEYSAAAQHFILPW